MQAEYDQCQGINGALCAFARGETVDYCLWPEILDHILMELDRVARTEFPIPALPPPLSHYHNAPLADFMSDFSFSSNSTSSSAPSSPFSHALTPPSAEDDKDNAAYSAHVGPDSAGAAAALVADHPAEAFLPGLDPMLDSESGSESGSGSGSGSGSESGSGSGSEPALALPPSPPAAHLLPAQIEDMLDEITTTLRTFFAGRPPHTIQRLAELILAPHANYRSLAPYLAAVDKVVHVSSGLDAYPLPLAATEARISDGDDPTGSVSWANPAGPAVAAPALGAGPVLAETDVGFDEVLGGALLSPIPWLRERSSSEEYDEEADEDEDGFFGEAMSAPPGTVTTARGAHLRSESTVTVDGPNGMGRIETVSVSINGLPCVGTSALLTGRHFYHHQMQHVIDGEDDAAGEDDDDEALYPHLRAPVQMGADDPASQRQRRYFDGQAVSLVGMDLDAPVGPQPNTSPVSSPEIGGSDEGDDEGDEGEEDDEAEDDDDDDDDDDPDLDGMDLDQPELPGMLDREGGRDPVPVSSPPSSGSESSEYRWR